VSDLLHASLGAGSPRRALALNGVAELAAIGCFLAAAHGLHEDFVRAGLT